MTIKYITLKFFKSHNLAARVYIRHVCEHYMLMYSCRTEFEDGTCHDHTSRFSAVFTHNMDPIAPDAMEKLVRLSQENCIEPGEFELVPHKGEGY